MTDTTAQKKVLIVEDEKDLREAVVAALTLEGYNTMGAVDGEEGLQMALTEKPDLILLDIMMPKMDGVAVLGGLRADEWGKDAKVIVMTALDDLAKIAEVIEAGGHDYVIKTSITLKGIVDKVREKIG